ncbi:hypothetical protein RR48_04851 [Papilio machaon]|uniref:Uncharacterized protein n=1 Tax=Papilio machaon TaxID=76193 RepID=A0A0N0PD26_PAPMA|nr:hypothetical protein RR48_04851 [Papilio machaon]
MSTVELGNRFGEGTTQRLPLEAQGDRDLVDRLSKLPLDKQPFWFINWQALEAHRQRPQSYPIRPNPFAQNPIVPNNSGNFNTGDLGNRSGDANKNTSANSSSSAPPSTETIKSSTNPSTLKSQESNPKSTTSNKDAIEKKL